MNGNRARRHGRPTCPVCGRGFVGSLDKHLNHILTGWWNGQPGENYTRCDWNLNCFRVSRLPSLMMRGGWIPAGQIGANVVKHLATTHPHLAHYAASGAVAIEHSPKAFDPAHDNKVWWTRPWVAPIVAIKRWRVHQRLQMIIELDGNDVVQGQIMGVHAVGGPDAVAAMEGTAFPKRCQEWSPEPFDGEGGRSRGRGPGVDYPMPRGGFKQPFDWCVLPLGHGGPHMGCRTRVRFHGGAWLS